MIVVDGFDVLFVVVEVVKKVLVRLEVKEVVVKVKVKKEEERVVELKKVRGEKWLFFVVWVL